MKKLTEYKNNRENPFLEKSLEIINDNIVKKYKSSTMDGEKAILQAYDRNTDSFVGHTSFVRQIEVDEEKFTKLYLSQFSAFWELKAQAIRVFGYVMTKLMPKQDMFIFASI